MSVFDKVILHRFEKDSLLVLPLVHKVGCMRAIHDKPVCRTIKINKNEHKHFRCFVAIDGYVYHQSISAMVCIS